MDGYHATADRCAPVLGRDGPGYAAPLTGPAYRDAGLRRPAALRRDLALDVRRAALVVVDPYRESAGCDAASRRGPDATARDRATRNLVLLLESAKRAGIVVAVSLTRRRTGAAGADLEPRLLPFIDDGLTVVCRAPSRLGDRINDLGRWLCRRRVEQVVLTGLIDAFPIVMHLRELAEQGFEVVVVRDAVVGTRLPEGEGYLHALVGFSGIAKALWTTRATIERIEGWPA